MMKKILFLFILFSVVTFSKTITIAVATNVSYAIDALKKKFNTKYPDIKVNVILGSSGKLTTQIKNSAPFGLFMSADMRYPTLLFKEKIAIKKPVIYAQGKLVLFSPKPQVFSQDLSILTQPNIKRIAIANPKTAPYGKASLQALKNAKINKKIDSKLIYAQSLSQTLSYTLIATDIGFISKSSLFSKKMKKYKENIHWKEINSTLYTPINQGIVLLNKKASYQKFYNFILSHEAKNILKNYGYSVQ